MAYESILLKLSGEALGGEGDHGLRRESIETIATQIKDVAASGVRLAVVVGGGNILRGADVSDTISVRATADHMGMLATMINGLALMDGLERHGLDARLMSAIFAQQVAEPYIRRRALRHQDRGRIVILAGGTGNPLFTTDTTAALRACELGCDVVLKGTKVDGIYDKDPKAHADAVRFDHLTYQDVLAKNLRVMDLTAITMCMDNHMPIHVFDVLTEGNLARVVRGDSLGTTVSVD